MSLQILSVCTRACFKGSGAGSVIQATGTVGFEDDDLKRESSLRPEIALRIHTIPEIFATIDPIDAGG